jgi:trans-aconitate 2-methyltransferase
LLIVILSEAKDLLLFAGSMPERMSDPPKSREWDAAEYHRLSAPQFQWGLRVIRELRLRSDECLLDAGCGTGKLTRILLQNLPRGRVVGLDLSRNMVLHAQQNLQPDFGDRVGFVAGDLVALPFCNCFDGIFSTASFHWVLDHNALFGSLYQALRPAGWLHAQCGGGPNLARLRQRVRALSQTAEFSDWLGKYPEPWFFSDAEGAAARLRAARFERVETGIEEAGFAVASNQEFQRYLRTFVLHRHLELLPNDALRSAFVEKLADTSAHDDPPWTLDYWRLNLRAHKPCR